MDLRLEIFVPPVFKKKPFDVRQVEHFLGKRPLHYAAAGRYAFFHILKAYNICRIYIPNLLCVSVLQPMRELGVEFITYDIDPLDLNPSFESFAKQFVNEKADAVIVPSFYGNPADLTRFEEYAKQHGIVLIDDAAQSFGATLETRAVGSFGQAGFFSFSPGKATAGHLGAFFWMDNEKYTIAYTHIHDFIHKIIYWDFYLNRLNRYRFRKTPIGFIVNRVKSVSMKLVNLAHDNMAPFEGYILGGIVDGVLNGEFEFRKEYVRRWVSLLENQNYLRPIINVRGTASPHKLICVAETRSLADRFRMRLRENRFYSSAGYRLIDKQCNKTPHAASLSQRIIEIPIEQDQSKMDSVFAVTKAFVDANS